MTGTEAQSMALNQINALFSEIYDEKCGVAEIEHNKYLSSQINFMVFLDEEPLGSKSANE